MILFLKPLAKNMITTEMIKIYILYNGSLGAYEFAKKKHLKILSWTEFNLIERLVQDIRLVKRGLAAKNYEHELNERLKENCDGEETVAYLYEIAIS